VTPLNEAEKSLGGPPLVESQKLKLYRLPAVVARVWERNPSEPTGPNRALHVPLWAEKVFTTVKPVFPL
jgi:hypothetical protein